MAGPTNAWPTYFRDLLNSWSRPLAAELTLWSRLLAGVAHSVELFTGWMGLLAGAAHWLGELTPWSRLLSGGAYWLERLTSWNRSLAGVAHSLEPFTGWVGLLAGTAHWLDPPTCWSSLLVVPTSCQERLPVCTHLPAAQNYCSAVRTCHILVARKCNTPFSVEVGPHAPHVLLQWGASVSHICTDARTEGNV
jgi:hypothetical protein